MNTKDELKKLPKEKQVQIFKRVRSQLFKQWEFYFCLLLNFLALYILEGSKGIVDGGAFSVQYMAALFITIFCFSVYLMNRKAQLLFKNELNKVQSEQQI